MKERLRLMMITSTFIMTILLLTSCWNYKEINDMSLIQGLAIDKKDSHYMITGKILLATTEQQKEGTLQHFFVNTKGVTLFDTIRNLILRDGKKVYFGHLQYVIVSEDIAREDVSQVLDIFMRDNETREDMWIFVAPNPYTSRDVLHGIAHQELANYVEDATQNVKNVAKFYPMKMYELVESMNEKGRDGVSPLMFLQTTDEGQSAHIQGTAVYKKNRMVGTLSGDESRMFMMLMGRGKSSIIPLIYNDEQHISKVSIDIFRDQSKLEPIIHDNDDITFNIHLSLSAVIGEIMNSQVNVTDERGRQIVAKKLEEYVVKNLSSLITRVQKEYKSDIFGFGEMVKNVNPDLWRNIEDDWNNIFPEVDVQVHATVEIIGSNLFKQVINQTHTFE